MDGINPNHYRIAVFGSARIEEDDPRYRQIYNLAKLIAQRGYDIVTGGGPSLMDAASRGHHAGRKMKDDIHTIGLTIHLTKKEADSYHLDIKEDYDKFSNRLDEFMELSDVVVVGPGGIGTMLELFYTWQLVQVGKIEDTPIILLGDRWEGFMDWMKEHVADEELMDQEDMDFIYVAEDNEEVMDYINRFHEDHKEKGHVCTDFEKH